MKSASGFDASAEENCFTRSSRERAMVSCTSSRTRFCTDVALPSPKRRSSSFASWPSSSPKTSANCCSKNWAIVRACSVNSCWTSREAFSNSVFTNSAFAPACSRSSTRAPISTASTTTLTGSSPFSRASADEADGAFVLDDEALDRDVVSDDADVRLPEWSGCFHVD